MAEYLLKITAAIALLMPVSGNALAQDKADPPIEITADGTLEWHRNDKKFIADKNAMAKQGDISIKASKLTALYRENKDSDFEIYNMRALENVIISNNETNAYGDLAVYEVDKELATMTGQDLKIVSPDQTLTAEDKFEYFVVKGELIAHGNAKVTRPKPEGGVDTLEAARVYALFENNDKGERVLKTMEAHDNVVITTPTEVITGDYGIYHASTNLAELKGRVTIKRGPNTLEGERAEVDLNTNISTLFGNGTSGDNAKGRVRGVFYPGSEKSEEERKEGTE